MVLLDVKTILCLEFLMEALRESSSSWKGNFNVMNPVSGEGDLPVESVERYLVRASEIIPLMTNVRYPRLLNAEYIISNSCFRNSGLHTLNALRA